MTCYTIKVNFPEDSFYNSLIQHQKGTNYVERDMSL